MPPKPLKHLIFQEGFINSLQVAATEFKKLREPKVAKPKGGYSSSTSQEFQLWLKDIKYFHGMWTIPLQGHSAG